MDIAITADDEPVTLELLRGMSVVPELWCPGTLPDQSECGGKAWPAALHSDKKAAYFAAHHRPGCDASSERTDDQDGDAGHAHPQGLLRPRWKVTVVQSASQGPDGRNRPDDDVSGGRTRRTFVDGAHGFADAVPQKSLMTILLNLIANTIPEGLELQVGARAWKPMTEVVMHISEATAERVDESFGIYWGEIEGFRRTRYESHMLRLKDAADGVAILLDAPLASRLGLKDPVALVGRHVICLGEYKPAKAGGKPHIRVHEIGQLAFKPRFRRQS